MSREIKELPPRDQVDEYFYGIETIYRCKFCGKICYSLKEVREHVSVCIMNKKNKACKTCKNNEHVDDTWKNDGGCNYTRIYDKCNLEKRPDVETGMFDRGIKKWINQECWEDSNENI